MTAVARADLHVHSTASQISRLGVQRALGLPECATPRHEVYELAKRRGMDLVTITDHDTIAGALQLADRPDAFICEELTAGFTAGRGDLIGLTTPGAQAVTGTAARPGAAAHAGWRRTGGPAHRRRTRRALMLVVDASAITELLLGRRAGSLVAQRIRDHDFDLHAPHLLDVEVLSALRRLVAAGDASPGRAGEAVADFLDLPVERYAHDALAPRIWDLRANFSAHDATYVALAEAITDDGAPLLTADARLARAAGAHTDLRVLVAD